jgi:glycosyltransferase involved in cell wall biosynthesis
MWNSGRTPTRVIDHGVMLPAGVSYTGEVERGLVIVNHMRDRGRRLGSDIFARARQHIPLDLVGMDSESLGGLGEIQPPRLPAFESHYRFYFHPLRFTSLGLALIEAMMIGLPVVGLATTELVTVIQNGINGFIDTDVEKLFEPMRMLLADPSQARSIGRAGQRVAAERFNMRRFVHDWNETLADVVGRPLSTGRRIELPLSQASGGVKVVDAGAIR